MTFTAGSPATHDPTAIYQDGKTYAVLHRWCSEATATRAAGLLAEELNSLPAQREAGWYWVKYTPDEWAIAYHHGNGSWNGLLQGYDNDSIFTKIGSRILPPDPPARLFTIGPDFGNGLTVRHDGARYLQFDRWVRPGSKASDPDGGTLCSHEDAARAVHLLCERLNQLCLSSFHTRELDNGEEDERL